jgi:hypothetical protein
MDPSCGLGEATDSLPAGVGHPADRDPLAVECDDEGAGNACPRRPPAVTDDENRVCAAVQLVELSGDGDASSAGVRMQQRLERVERTVAGDDPDQAARTTLM